MACSMLASCGRRRMCASGLFLMLVADVAAQEPMASMPGSGGALSLLDRAQQALKRVTGGLMEAEANKPAAQPGARPGLGGSTLARPAAAGRNGMESLIGEISGTIEAAIILDLNHTQNAIDMSILDYSRRSYVVAELKTDADQKDNELLLCREKERALFAQAVNYKTESDKLAAEKDEACKDLDEPSKSKWVVSLGDAGLVRNGTCDLETDDCESFDQFSQAQANAKDQIDKARETYLQKTEACFAARDAFAAHIDTWTVSDTTGDPLQARRKECGVKARGTTLAMCQFGLRAQELCESRRELVEIIDAARGNGTMLSQDDLKNMWSTIRTVKCVFEKYAKDAKTKAKASLTEDMWQGCLDELDFEKDVGELAHPAGIDKGYCDDQTVVFSGMRWQVGSNLGDYVRLQFTPSFTVTSGSSPFAFCER